MACLGTKPRVLRRGAPIRVASAAAGSRAWSAARADRVLVSRDRLASRRGVGGLRAGPKAVSHARGVHARSSDSEASPPSTSVSGAGSKGASALQKTFHVLAFVQTFAIWFWHFTPLASYLPGASLPGFFFRYLTFCTYTLQMVYLACACVSDFAGEHKVGPRFLKATGILAGIAFTMSNVVTIMYYGIHQRFDSPIEGSHLDRPPYMNLSVHLFNAMIGWFDLLTTSNMNLCSVTIKYTYLYGLVYTVWMQFLKHYTGVFPYPFLDRLPFLVGPLAIIFTAFAVLQVIFSMGRRVRTKLGKSNE